MKHTYTLMDQLIESLCPGIQVTSRQRLRLLIQIVVCLSLLLPMSGTADARGLKVKRQARAYQVEVAIDQYPLFIGENHIEIDIRDASGQSVTDADVLVNYYMPPMPRMVPMNYKTKARQESLKYKADMDIIMAGPWYIKVIIKHAGKISTTKFNVDAQ